MRAFLRLLAGVAMVGGAPALSQTTDPIGAWENARTGVVIEFLKDGAVNTPGSPAAHFEMCGAGGGNICITGKGFSCHYRAALKADAMTLTLSTGRPTKECPEGLFHPKRG